MAEPSIPVPAPALGRRKKNVLIPFGGKSQLDANRRLFEWSALHIFEPGDNLFVFHFYRKSAFKSVTAIAGGSSPTAAAATTTTDAHPQRPGFTLINIDGPLPPPHPDAADTKPTTTTEPAEEKTEGGQRLETALDAGTGAINDPAEAEWLPRAVSDALRGHRAASPSSFVVVFQMDSAAGPNSAEVRVPFLPLPVHLCNPSRRCFAPVFDVSFRSLSRMSIPFVLRDTRISFLQMYWYTYDAMEMSLKKKNVFFFSNSYLTGSHR